MWRWCIVVLLALMALPAFGEGESGGGGDDGQFDPSGVGEAGIPDWETGDEDNQPEGSVSTLEWLVSFFRKFFRKCADMLQWVWYDMLDVMTSYALIGATVILERVISDDFPAIDGAAGTARHYAGLANYWVPLQELIGLAISYIIAVIIVFPIKMLLRAVF